MSERKRYLCPMCGGGQETGCYYGHCEQLAQEQRRQEREAHEAEQYQQEPQSPESGAAGGGFDPFNQ